MADVSYVNTAFLCRKASASSSRRSLESKRYFWRNLYICIRSYGFWIHPYLIPTYTLYLDSGTREKDSSEMRSHHLRKIPLCILHHVESYAMHIPLLCSWFFPFKLNLIHNFIFVTNPSPFLLLRFQGKCSAKPPNGLGHLYSFMKSATNAHIFDSFLLSNSN
jgi:hypothetical protein